MILELAVPQLAKEILNELPRRLVAVRWVGFEAAEYEGFSAARDGPIPPSYWCRMAIILDDCL
jgi:hypothetical protein